MKQSYTKKEKYIQELSSSNRSFYKDTKSREDELIPGIQKVIAVVYIKLSKKGLLRKE